MHEDLAGKQIDDLGGGDAAVGAADPEMFRELLPRQTLEKRRVAFGHPFRPGSIVVKEILEFHGRHFTTNRLNETSYQPPARADRRKNGG
jgi:hypothetical protein